MKKYFLVCLGGDYEGSWPDTDAIICDTKELAEAEAASMRARRGIRPSSSQHVEIFELEFKEQTNEKT